MRDIIFLVLLACIPSSIGYKEPSCRSAVHLEDVYKILRNIEVEWTAKVDEKEKETKGNIEKLKSDLSSANVEITKLKSELVTANKKIEVRLGWSRSYAHVELGYNVILFIESLAFDVFL